MENLLYRSSWTMVKVKIHLMFSNIYTKVNCLYWVTKEVFYIVFNCELWPGFLHDFSTLARGWVAYFNARSCYYWAAAFGIMVFVFLFFRFHKIDSWSSLHCNQQATFSNCLLASAYKVFLLFLRKKNIRTVPCSKEYRDISVEPNWNYMPCTERWKCHRTADRYHPV